MENILTTRIKLTNSFPGMKNFGFETEGQIFEPRDIEELTWPKKYPKNFEVLPWWEERTEEQMPKYLKFHQIVYEVEKHFIGYAKDYVKVYDGKIYHKLRYETLEPANIEEYILYLKINNHD